MKILRKNQKEMLEIKNTVTEMKNAFDGLVSRPDTVEDKNFWVWGYINRTFNIEKQREQRLKKKPEYPRTVEELQKVSHMCNGNIRRRIKRERNRKNIWNHNDWEFPQINVRNHTIHLGSSENTKQDVRKKKQKQPGNIIFKLQSIKGQGKNS